ncbi:MAG: bifunctional 5,10-methylenetetrahydrofolate dehydrogenase/5,10-methenyltetrahydrofolate cyclohydrolase [Elusimicrobia bacterium]|nr:bifunctional 5,10-methylenetetrahydrofolate dehydrogenase/5,10-methenyltetrahydrofolate cyclohydrolase [Elusimicrobiota bacterium]
MAATIIDGKALAASIRKGIASEIAALASENHRPGLATVLVGDDPASAVYVRNKIQACREVGMAAIDRHLPISTSEKELLHHMKELTDDPKVNGILVQLPLPDQISPMAVFEAMPEAKDVDGFGIANWGRLFLARTPKELEHCFVPCTPLGVLRMIESAGVNPEGKMACVLGRSNIVGKPMAHLLTLYNATATVVHSKTKNLPQVVKQADIVVAAIGKALFVTADMVRPGACVVDVGINRNENGKLVGDCDFEALRDKAGYLSPVPGGVGPMTIAMLLSNTLKAWKRTIKSASPS